MKQKEFVIRQENSKEDYVSLKGLLEMLNIRAVINKMNLERQRIFLRVKEEKAWEYNKPLLNSKKSI
jgi:hypothetical protein